MLLLLTPIVFLAILSVLVLVHEFGHFFTAKKFDIRVEEFGYGIPPRLWGKRIGETIYSLNWLPFGGFVKLTGEDPSEELNDPNVSRDARSFSAKPWWRRAIVLSAGVFMNFILASVLFYIVLASNNFKTSYLPVFFDYTFVGGTRTEVSGVVTGLFKDSAAEKAGIEIGEAIAKIDGLSIHSSADVRAAVKGKQGLPVTIELLDIRTTEGKTRNVTAYPLKDKDGNEMLGVYLSRAAQIDYSQNFRGLPSGMLHTYNVIGYSLKALKTVIGFSVEQKTLAPVSESISGPVGIYSVVGSLLQLGGTRVVYNVLDFTALMSASLAFINILPFPALDGGRLIFVMVEGVTKRKVNPRVEMQLHKYGFALLLLLLLAVTAKDIVYKIL